MKVYTRIVVDISTDTVLDEASFDYVGPVFDCKKSKSKSTQKVQLDPATERLNQIRLQTEELLQPWRNDLINALRNPEFAGPAGIMLPTPELATAFGKLFDLSDITDLKEESKRIFEETTVPSIQNKLTAGGFGRSGAVGAAIGKAGAGMTLPLLEASRNAKANFINALLGFEGAKLGGVTGMLGTMPPFMAAPTTTIKNSTSGGFNPFDLIIPGISAGIGGLSSLFGGGGGMGMGGGGPGLGTFGSPAGSGFGGGPNRFSIL